MVDELDEAFDAMIANDDVRVLILRAEVPGGDYMKHGVHWGLIDGWFDIECPQRMVDLALVPSVGNIDRSVIV